MEEYTNSVLYHPVYQLCVHYLTYICINADSMCTLYVIWRVNDIQQWSHIQIICCYSGIQLINPQCIIVVHLSLMEFPK